MANEWAPFDAFLPKAMALGQTLEEAQKSYREITGQPPVLRNAPKRGDWVGSLTDRGFDPGQVEDLYNQLYVLGPGEEFTRGLKRGAASLEKGLFTIGKLIGGEGSEEAKFFEQQMPRLEQRMQENFRSPGIQPIPTPADLSLESLSQIPLTGSEGVFHLPRVVGTLGDLGPSLAASAIPGLGAASALQRFGPAVARLGGSIAGGAAGGALEGAGTAQEVFERGGSFDEARDAFLKMGAGSAVLNALPFAAALSGRGPAARVLGAGAAEAFTEAAEEPLSRQILNPDESFAETMRQSVPAMLEVGVPAFLSGGLLGGAAPSTQRDLPLPGLGQPGAPDSQTTPPPSISETLRGRSSPAAAQGAEQVGGGGPMPTGVQPGTPVAPDLDRVSFADYRNAFVQQAETPSQEPAQAAYQEIRERGYISPLDPSMTFMGSNTWVDVRPFNGALHLSAIATLPEAQNQGEATRVMRELMDTADRHQVPITLTAKPFGTQGARGLSKTALRDWYRRLGFEGKGDNLTYQPKRPAIPGQVGALVPDEIRPLFDEFRKAVASPTMASVIALSPNGRAAFEELNALLESTQGFEAALPEEVTRIGALMDQVTREVNHGFSLGYQASVDAGVTSDVVGVPNAGVVPFQSLLDYGDLPIAKRDANTARRFSPEQQALVDQALTDLMYSGMPATWFQGLRTIAALDTKQSRDLGMFARFSRSVFINRNTLDAATQDPDMLRTQLSLRGTLAHELGHSLDFHLDGTISSVVSPYFELDVGAMSLNAENGTLDTPDDSVGPIMREMLAVWGANPHGLGRVLNYPFASLPGMVATPSVGPEAVMFYQYEAFAQLVGLYFTHRELVQQYMPTGYNFVQELINATNTAESAGDRDTAVRAVFRGPGAGRGDQGDAGGPVAGTVERVAQERGTGEGVGPVQRQRRAAPTDQVSERIVTRSGRFRVNAVGDMSGAPAGINTQEAYQDLVDQQVQEVEAAVELAPDQLHWYRDSGLAIKAVTRGNPAVREKVIRMFAVLSANNSVQSNTTAAVQAVHEAVVNGNNAPLVGLYPNVNAQKIPAILEARQFTKALPGIENKVMSFYRNLKDEVAGTNTWPNEATLDVWIARQFNYTILTGPKRGEPAEGFNPTQYSFGLHLMRDITDAYNALHGTNYKPRQIQAVLWTKARIDAGKQPAGAETVSFATELARATENVTWEVDPHPDTGIVLDQNPVEKRRFLKKAVKLITKGSRDDLADRVGIPMHMGKQGRGSFESAVNPNMISGLVARKVRISEAKRAEALFNGIEGVSKYTSDKRDPLVYDQKDATVYAHALMYIYRQKAVPWFRADPNPTSIRKGALATGRRIDVGKTITEGMAQDFMRRLESIDPSLGFTQIDKSNIVVINYRDTDPNSETFGSPFGLKDKAFSSAMEQFAADIGAQDLVEFSAETFYDEHDWKADPEGKALEDKIRAAGRSDLLPWLRDRRQAFDQLIAEEQGPVAPQLDQVAQEQVIRDLTDRDTAQEENAASPEALVSPVTGTPHQMALGLRRLGKENQAIVEPVLDQIDAELGTDSRTNFKKIKTIEDKARRPEVLKKKPWFTVAHIRDGFRFMTAINQVSDVTRAMELIRDAGIGIVKTDTAKFLNPGPWGWRIIVFDLRFPNGQIVEYYLPVKEMEAQKQDNHLLFEKWRDEDLDALTQDQRLEFEADLEASAKTYQAAFDASLERTGQDESAVRASLNNLLASLGGASTKSSISSFTEGMPLSDQEPSGARTAQKPESITTTRGPSRSTATVINTSGIDSVSREEDLDQEPPTIRFTPPGTPTEDLPKYAASINLDKLSSPEDIKALVKQIVEEQEQVHDTARRGIRGWGTTERAAEALGMSVKDLVNKPIGRAYNAEQIEAARTLLEASAKDLQDKAIQANLSGSHADNLLMQEAYLRHVMIQAQYSGIATEAGRALNILRKTSAEASRIGRVVEDLQEFQDLGALAKKLAELDTTGQLSRHVRETYVATLPDKLLELWINALLSGPQTHAVNALSNTLVGEVTAVEHFLGAMIGKLHGGEKITFREAMSYAVGGIQGAREGLRLGVKAYATEEPQSSPQGKLEVRRYQAIGGRTGRLVRVPGRALMAEDEFFKAMGRRRMLNALAMRRALAEGLDGQALQARYQELVANPPEDMQETARQHADYVTFTNRLGSFGRSIQHLVNQHPLLRVVMPFVRTPTNIVKFAFHRSPFAPLFKDVRAELVGKRGKAARDLAWGRILFGSSLGALAASLVAEGLITGGGPDDPNRRRVMRAQGWQPYSIYHNGEWIAYNRLEPLGMLLGISADMVEIQQWMTEDENANLAALITGSIAKNLTSKTWLRGISELVNAVEDPDRYGSSYIRNLVGTVVPTGVAQVARVQDPMLRDARTVLDKIKSRIPGKTEEVVERVDIWGNPIYLEGGVGPDLLSPIYTSRIKSDRATQALIDAEYFPGKLSRKIGGVELTPQQYLTYQQEAGRTAYLLASQVAASDAFRTLPRYTREQALTRIFQQARRAARQRTLMRYPALQSAVQSRLVADRLR